MNYLTVIFRLFFIGLFPLFIPLSKVSFNPVFAQEISFFRTSPRLLRTHSTLTIHY